MSRSLKLLAVLFTVMGMGTVQASEPAATDEPSASKTEAAAQLREAIQTARQTDPELAQILQQELDDLVRGADEASSMSRINVAHANPDAHALFNEPTFGGPTGVGAEQLEHDPRLLDLRAQYEAGALNDEEVHVRMAAILRDYGMLQSSADAQGPLTVDQAQDLPPEAVELMDHLLHDSAETDEADVVPPPQSLEELKAMEPPIFDSGVEASEPAEPPAPAAQ